MLDPYFKVYHEVRQKRVDRYDVALSNGSIDPFVYPRETISVLVLLLAILFIPQMRTTYRIKRTTSVLAFLVVSWLCGSTVYRCRTIAFAGGYGIGLMCAWGIVASGYLLVFNDLGTAFQRLEKRDVTDENGTALENSRPQNGSVTTGRHLVGRSASSGLNNRKIWGVNGTAITQATDPRGHQDQSQYSLVWQAFPEPLAHRLDWAIDLATSFRGVHWNWRVSSLPEIDTPQKGISGSASGVLHSSPPSAMQALRRQAVYDFILHYFLIDLVKTITITDPYFHGTASLSSPSPWLFLQGNPTLTWLIRLTMSLAGVVSALTFIFSLSPLIFPLLPQSITLAPLHEPALYPPYWGPLGTSVLDKGLPGLWGKWWHQMFRFGISEPSRYLIEVLGLPPRSKPARIITVLVAFAVSGSIHATASYTAFLPSRPLGGPFAFFMLQGVGVLGQPAFLKYLSANAYDTRTLPTWLRRTGNGLFVASWLFLTGPLLANDFASCGIWLFEPLPISLLRGVLGQGYWCWSGQRVAWWPGREGESWWRQGIAVI